MKKTEPSASKKLGGDFMVLFVSFSDVCWGRVILCDDRLGVLFTKPDVLPSCLAGVSDLTLVKSQIASCRD